MSLDYAILGFLNIHPYTGYDLKKVFDQSVRHFWPADQAQIYRTLAKLTKRGLAEMEVIHQEDRPDRKVYHITEGGRKELLGWLATSHPTQETRSADLIQVFFAGELSDEVALKVFERHAKQLRSILKVYNSIPLDYPQVPPQDCDERRQFFRLLTLECGIAMARAELAWTENAIERLKKADYTLFLSTGGDKKGAEYDKE
jgi:PadR family transcriptional regulator AphA